MASTCGRLNGLRGSSDPEGVTMASTCETIGETNVIASIA